MGLQETFNDVHNALKKIMIRRRVFTTLLSNGDKVHLIHHYYFCLFIVNSKLTSLNITAVYIAHQFEVAIKCRYFDTG